MKYDASHMRNPGVASSYQLANYVSGGGGPVVDRRGMPIGEDELDAFRATVNGSDSSAMHTFSFTKDIPAEELIDGVREPAREHLDGQYVVGIHTETEHNHIHIGECGTLDELRMSASDVRGFGKAVADSCGVSYG